MVNRTNRVAAFLIVVFVAAVVLTCVAAGS
jgi:hypothetical protein